MDDVPIFEGAQQMPVCAVFNRLVAWLVNEVNTYLPSIVQHVCEFITIPGGLSNGTFTII